MARVKVCTSCGEHNPPGDVDCGNCGVSIVGALIEDEENLKRGVERETLEIAERLQLNAVLSREQESKTATKKRGGLRLQDWIDGSEDKKSAQRRSSRRQSTTEALTKSVARSSGEALDLEDRLSRDTKMPTVRRLPRWLKAIIAVFIIPLAGGIMEPYSGGASAGGVMLALILGMIAWAFYSPRNRPLCSWCGSRKVKFKSGQQGDWFWKYRNKDGSKDSRVRDNIEWANFLSDWSCKKCEATTRVSHTPTESPSVKDEPWLRVRCLKDGKGIRKRKDWVSPDRRSGSGERRKKDH